MRIAMLAPPWIPVPAPGYGGIEEVIRLLCEGMVARGHAVTLFAPPASSSPAAVRAVLEAAHPDEIERARWEVDHVARAFAAIDREAQRGEPFDVVHDHCGFGALAMADRLGTPLVHTLHGPFDQDNVIFYRQHGPKATIVAISHAQLADAPPALHDAAVVHNPLSFDEWTLSTEPGEHALWIGRMAPVKGPHRAIEAALEAGVPLVLAGPIQPGQDEYFAREVEPAIDGEHVRYVGELDTQEKMKAYGEARAVLMPIRWAEPFGLVMTEAMACGTPVIAFGEGAAPEVVTDGVTGWVVEDEHEMAAALGRVDEIDRAACREHAERSFGLDAALDGYERVYARAARTGGRHAGFGRRRADRIDGTGHPPHARPAAPRG
jgi:glycosyltransferase involved in cell wall biosynthesis